jgi:hypothetical protein
VDDAVGVDVEGDLDLRDATRGRAMPESSKVPSGLFCCAISRSPWKTWISTDGLVVLGGGEDLGPLGRDGGVALDELGEQPPLVSMPRLSG